MTCRRVRHPLSGHPRCFGRIKMRLRENFTVHLMQSLALIPQTIIRCVNARPELNPSSGERPNADFSLAGSSLTFISREYRRDSTGSELKCQCTLSFSVFPSFFRPRNNWRVQPGRGGCPLLLSHRQDASTTRFCCASAGRSSSSSSIRHLLLRAHSAARGRRFDSPA